MILGVMNPWETAVNVSDQATVANSQQVPFVDSLSLHGSVHEGAQNQGLTYDMPVQRLFNPVNHSILPA
jgi:hypothetical protein